MALAAIINAEVLNGLSADVKKEYKKRDDGTFILDVTPIGDFALEDVKGLKSALSSERTAKEEATKKVKAFEGLDADKARSALQKVEDMANWKPEEKVKEQIEAIKKQLVEKHQGELGARETSIKTMTSQLEKVMVEASAIKALAEHKGSTTLLLPHVKSATRMRQTDKGEYIVEVVDANGQVRISPAAGSTAPMTIAELVAEMKNNNTYSPAFEGTGASGSGANGGTGGPGGGKGGTHVISEADAKNVTKYRAAKDAAQKAGCQLEIRT